jgi:hypothetical protein
MKAQSFTRLPAFSFWRSSLKKKGAGIDIRMLDAIQS